MLLFGAGASFGAGGIVPEQPPLGSGLYSELRRLCPGTWGALPIALASELERDFESGMATVATTICAAVPMLMRDMATYFVQFRPVGKASLYDRLVRDLESRGVLKQTIFSTLNYECILEYSLLQAGHSLDYFDVIADASVPVLKLMLAHESYTGCERQLLRSRRGGFALAPQQPQDQRQHDRDQ